MKAPILNRLRVSGAHRQVLCSSAVALISAMAAFAVSTPRTIADVPIPVPNGKAINLRQYRGKVVLLAMIDTECAQCIKSIDILNRAQKDFGPRGFQAIAAAGDPNAQYVLLPFIQRYRPIFPMGYLTVEQMIRLGDFTQKDQPFAPIFLFIDRKGVVQRQFQGDHPFFKVEEESTRGIIQQMLLH